MPPTIKDILEGHGIATVGEEHKHGRRGWVQVDCPWCGTEGKFHLGISLSTGAASCWVCGRKNTAAVLAHLTGVPQAEARRRVDAASLDTAPIRHTGRLVLPGCRQPMAPAHKAYLARRGLDANLIAERWGVEGIGIAPRLGWRLFIPIHHHGQIISWTTRAIGDRVEQRYLSAAEEEEAIPHKHILYGADFARHAIIIHEGPLDVWRVGPGAVATCGTAYTEAQLLAMSRYMMRVVCFDTEPLAQRRARQLADALSPFPGTTYNLVLETGTDPVEAQDTEIAAIRREFLP